MRRAWLAITQPSGQALSFVGHRVCWAWGSDPPAAPLGRSAYSKVRCQRQAGFVLRKMKRTDCELTPDWSV